MIHALAFMASGAVVIVAATALARFADAIAEGTGLGRLWIGTVLLAGATSLPELATDVAAVRLGAPDLAVGDLFGSSMANMLILSVIDLIPVRGRVLRQVAFDHVLAASLAISANAVAAALILVRPGASVLGISPGSALLLAMCASGSWVLYRHTPAVLPALPPQAKGTHRDRLVRASLGFAAAAVVVLAASPAFAWAARGLAETTGLGETFVGTWLVGLATSLPELVASFAAVRMGAFDLAVGNLFGSNAFNMAIFFALDVAQPGSLFVVIEVDHAITALFAIVLMSIGIAAIVFRAKRRIAVVEPDSLLMLAAYLIALAVLYLRATGR